MTDDKKPDLKKGFSGGFIWFLMGAVILSLMVQTFIETKHAKVSFSYQLEHLVNLQLIQPEDSRKSAINDNLVTFSGQFRDRLTEEGKARYKFLELLNANNTLKNEKEVFNEELDSIKGKVVESANLFLNLSGVTIPSSGYVVIDEISNATEEKDRSVVITKLTPVNGVTLPELKTQYSNLANGQNEVAMTQFGNSLTEFIHTLRSPELGVGNEPMKQLLRKIDTDVANANTAETALPVRLAVYEKTLAQIGEIIDQLNTPEGNTRLAQLRSVRNYKEAVDEYNHIGTQIEDNQVQLDKARRAVAQVIWFFNNQELSTKALEKQDPEALNHWFLNAKEEWNAFNTNRGGVFKAPDQPTNSVLEKKFKSEEPAPNYVNYIVTLLPVILVVLVLYFLFSRQMKGVGNSAMNFGKSPAKLLQKGTHKVTFKDVAGIDEALEELTEIVEFLKNPKKFTALGGHIPKGVLCIGAPGTGKTLIAKAVAGEADRPFFSISGSDFVEMFVGVGASRIRDMFDQAKKNAPCIVFIDEIDAVGRHRGAGIGGGHDEREQTLNQLLVEMDGFDTNEGVILIAATNRPDVLDKALLRPGRFDRRVIINLPDIKGRYEILKVHAKKIKMDTSVDLMNLARSTPGCSGADLENILNESALLAARRDKTAVTQSEITEARDKVLYGKERRSMELDEGEKRTTAYHEAGHTIVSVAVEHGDPVDKVTIIPRGMSLGATMFLPKKNRVSYWKKEILDQLAVLMGGRCAEEIFVGDISSGARQDIDQATQLARSMVCEWGMSDKLGLVSYDVPSGSGQYLGMNGYQEKKYSDETAQSIDAEVREILNIAHERALKIIEERREQLELLTEMLMEFETLDADDIKKIANNQWDIDEKRKRLKLADDLQKKKPITPVPPTSTSEKGPRPSATPPTLPQDLRA